MPVAEQQRIDPRRVRRFSCGREAARFATVRPPMTKRLIVLLVLVAVGALATAVWWHRRHAVEDVMRLAVREFSAAEYPEDPAERSASSGRYQGRSLMLVRQSDESFDFIFEPKDSGVARVAFRNVNVKFMCAAQPAWTRSHAGNALITLLEREWNRQQVSFTPGPNLEVTGGDGWERTNLFTAELANNCLGAGQWEVLLYSRENGQKTLYYQGWFQFPLGHYRTVVERYGGVRWTKAWLRLGRWVNPGGTAMDLKALRSVAKEFPAKAGFTGQETVLAEGEQQRKVRTSLTPNVRRYADWFDGRTVTFASFVSPGRYDVRQPWRADVLRLGRLERAWWRDIKSPATAATLNELELIFRDPRNGRITRLLVSGFDPHGLPQLAPREYPRGVYRPLGVGVPPVFQSYDVLTILTPWNSAYFSVLLDDKDRWLDHHRIGIDGVVLHRDAQDAGKLHLLLLAYERHAVLAHFEVDIPPLPSAAPAPGAPPQ